MSLTLGEKLRQAREERGTTISEVAEQTRISALYIESIERDDYRTLPGGIFNKGFVKSFARYVGVDEQEALQDYARLVANQDNQIVDEPKTYRPEVLTDDRHSSSKLTTIIFAGVILALMVAGILALLRYIEPSAPQPSANTAVNVNANSIANITLPITNTAATPSAGIVSMNDLKVEVTAVNSPVSLGSTSDGTRSDSLITPETPKVFEPKQSLRLKYSKSKAQNVRLTINGKQIALPTAPESANRSAIEFEINKDNLQRFWESGQVTYGAGASPR